MVEAGAAVVVDDTELDGDTLRGACDLLFDDRRTTMSEAAASVARPDSALANALILELLASRRSLPTQGQLEAMTREAL